MARSAEQILAEWHDALAEAAQIDLHAPDWAERDAASATRRADLMVEASTLNPMPREVALYAVGMAAQSLQRHAETMRPTA